MTVRTLLVRIDAGELAKPVTMPDGTVVYEGRAARMHAPGDGLDYGTHQEYRDRAELQRIVDQLIGRPLCSYHDETKIVGTVLASWLDGEHAIVRFAVADADARAAITSGEMAELSLGYECTIDSSSYQRGINVRELSLVPRARCGGSCAVRGDQSPDPKADGHGTCTCTPAKSCKNGSMDFEKLYKEQLVLTAAEKARGDEASKRADASTARAETAENALTVATARADGAESTSKKLEGDLARTEGERDAAKVRADAAEKAHKDLDDGLAAKMRARIDLENRGRALLAKDVDVSKLSDRDLMVAIVKQVDSAEIPADKSAEYVLARYDAAIERTDASTQSRADARAAVDGAPAPGKPLARLDDEATALKKLAEHNRNAWRTATTASTEN